MVGLYTGGLILGVGGLYVYGNCLIAMGIEWFEPVFGLASKAFVHLSACRVSEI